MPVNTPPPPVSETRRAAVTVALAAYLAGLALCVAGNTSSGGSAVVRTVKAKLFSPWMAPLWLDLGYDTLLTHGRAEDGDHRLEIRRLDALGAAGPVVLPARSLGGERAARWRRLARAVAEGEADPDREALLPAAVGAGAFAPWSTRDVSVRVMRHLPPDRADVLTGVADAAGRDDEAYAARVRLVAGEVQLIKSTPREELAPLVQEPTP
ncbi:MAG: hypothetical protein EBZ74_00290 [Planctomycetia bacterium]|nr:hypothetical protein [Planctomycetia bacterium]